MWVKVLPAKPHHLSSMPETHVVKGENQFLQLGLWCEYKQFKINVLKKIKVPNVMWEKVYRKQEEGADRKSTQSRL